MTDAEKAAAAEAEKAAQAKATAEAEAATAAKAKEEADAAEAAKAKAEADNPELAKIAKERDDLVKEVMSKKQRAKDAEEALTAAEARITETESKLKAFDGIDPEKVKTLLKGEDDREKAELEKAGEWTKLKQRMAEEHETELSGLKTTSEASITELNDKLSRRDSQIVELTIGREFSDSEFVNDSLTLTPSKARIIYGEHFEVVNGVVTGFDKPKGVESRTPIVDGSGNVIPFNDAIQRIVDADPDRDRLIRSKMKPGAGSTTDDGRTTGPQKSGRERIAAGLKKAGHGMA